MLGDVPMKVIDAVNAAIDNPSERDKEVSDFIDDDDYLGITKKAKHRQYGHDMAGFMRAVAISPEKGAEIYQCHMQLDVISDYWRDTYSTYQRDMMELEFVQYLKYMYRLQPKTSFYSVTSTVPIYKSSFKPMQKAVNFEKNNKFYKFKRKSLREKRKRDENFSRLEKLIYSGKDFF